VLAGDSARAAAEITAEADAAGLKGSQRAGADACVRYLTGKDECLRYEQALAAGWPIATGVIEGACRHIIGDRLCITGARWGLAGSEAVLTLRAVISNGDFDDYWRFHLAREHQRLYPAQPKASTHSAPDLPLCSIPAVPAGWERRRPAASPHPVLPPGTSTADGGNHRIDGRYPGRRGPSCARRRASRAHIITTSPGADSR